MGAAALYEIPKGFSRRIHDALRAWHLHSAKGLLDDLSLANHLPTGRDDLAPRLITNQILLNGIDCLKQADEEIADLLKSRFLNRETARELAYQRNWSEDVVFQRQRAAIARLAEVIWSQEAALRWQRRLRIEARLEPPSYSRLFGVEDRLAEVRAVLEKTAEPWLVSIEGMGGIGKSSLADLLARDLAGGTHFHDLAWVSARRRLFQLSGEIDTLTDRPALTLTELVDRCLEQFELSGLRHASDSEKLAGLKDFLRTHRCLVILDNLETVSDVYALVTQLSALVHPSKVLITTRHSLRDVSGVFPVLLRPLSRADTIALIRHEAETRGLPELAEAPAKTLSPIHKVTGGNPLAAKLIVGQIHSLSLPIALSRFSAAGGKPIEELLTYLYETSWHMLDPDCRQVLQAMLFVTEDGGRIEQIAATAGLGEGAVAACLQRLAALSLVNVSGDLLERRYSLHQLTHTFVGRQSAGVR